jgi:hypothetical protein
MQQRMVVLNGFEGHDAMGPRLSGLLGRLGATQDAVIREVVVQDLHLGHCIGCFKCFVETPGRCALRDDARSVLEAIIASDVLVLMGRLSFGGYSAALKRIVDRVLPLLVPFFYSVRGETHHPARYRKLPRIVALGVPRDEGGGRDLREEQVFRVLVGRNALNLHAPSHACEIVPSSASSADIEAQLRHAWQRSDPTAWRSELRALVPRPHEGLEAGNARPARLLLLVGSPKLGPSTSSAVGAYLESRLQHHGWETESLVLKSNLRRQEGQDALVAAVGRADLVALAFPLYVDALHTLPTLALEVLAERFAAESSRSAPKRWIAVANSGFPEAHQNAVALAICERFASKVGWAWAGGLALGGGEAISSGVPLDATHRSGRPPAHRVMRALDLATDALTGGDPIPDAAQRLLDQSPIPGLPASGWRALYRFMGDRGWHQLARSRSLGSKDLKARPLEGASA